MRIGVLALQGDFQAHAEALARRGARPLPLRHAVDAEALDGVVLPGGESTAMLKLMNGSGLGARLAAMVAANVPILATCAGVILLAREVRNPAQQSLALLDVVVERNGYGRQVDSTVASLDVLARDELGEAPLEGVFIRAPRILTTGPAVEVLARWRGDPVLVRGGRLLAATFHPELSEPSPVVDLFLSLCGGGS